MTPDGRSAGSELINHTIAQGEASLTLGYGVNLQRMFRCVALSSEQWRVRALFGQCDAPEPLPIHIVSQPAGVIPVNHPVYHPTEDELYNYVFDQTPPADPTHLTLCPTCRQTVEELTRLAQALTGAHLSQPSPAQSERCVKLFAQRREPAVSGRFL